MPSCFVPDCNHHSASDKFTCKFYSFPRNKKIFKKWEALIRRKDNQVKIDSRICSCHFPNGDNSMLPTIFQRNGNIDKHFRFSSPERIQRNRRCPLTENMNILNSEACYSMPCKIEKTHEFSSTFHEAEKYFLLKEIETLKEEVRRLHRQSFGFFSMANNDTMCLFYIGLHLEVFDIIQTLCSIVNFDYYDGIRIEIIPFKDQILLTLIKLRLNLTYVDLGWHFGISPTTAFRIVCTFLPVLHKIVYQSIMQKIPSREKNKSSLPLSFTLYTSCQIIVDCTEIRCEVPKRMDHQKSTYSSYKHFTSVKVLLVVAPNGTVVYCSPCYPGSTSDKQIFQHCGIIKQLVPGDIILADKGFLISDIVPEGVTVNIPPFLTCPQFTPAQVAITRNIARARIHVERANARLKHFRILNYFPHTLFSRASMIVQVCAGLINFQNPLIKEVEQHFYNVEDDYQDTGKE